MREKADAPEIRSYLASLNRDQISPAAPWWPGYAYHFTDIRNAIGIIERGEILSRRRALDEGMMRVENADTTIIARSPHLTESSARLYFRPRTPTQFRNEGIRPPANRSAHGAHCPVPVFFFFPLAALLTREDVKFTNTAAYWDEVVVGESVEHLRRMRWPDIYSYGSMPMDRRNELTGLRRAEILVPDSLPLTALQAIICRTPAERTTLLHFLSPELRPVWRQRIYVLGDRQRFLFEASWVYLEKILWSDTGLILTFNPRPVELSLSIEIRDRLTDKVIHQSTEPRSFANGRNIVTRPLPSSARNVLVRVTLDGCLAFEGALNRAVLLAP